ncbi:succinate dehydrogenase assembly factor 4 [Ferrovibrio sp.]|uniref:DUF1674 domain-containing protein n=1 Tax=Ferrovibrio sp. TaxID=1917215 RepID=UPI002620254F|nr:succinate dehydrogenase assembly factor 4 [Ferrovibrio sp.]
MTADTKPTGQPDFSLDGKATDAPIDTGPVDTRPADPKTGKPLAPAKPAVKLTQAPGEQEGPQGPEPTRYGDWERKGIVSDF